MKKMQNMKKKLGILFSSALIFGCESAPQPLQGKKISIFNKTQNQSIEQKQIILEKPYINKEIPYDEAFVQTIKPFKEFMMKNTREKDLALFFRIRNLENPQTIDGVPLTILMPAFMISELKTAFQIAFLLYLPFLVIDMVVSSLLMALGMMMLPPIMISLPFKILIFILVDGFNLLVGNLINSFK